MEKITFRALILTSACCLSAKHIYVGTGAAWGDARSACQSRFTDMSSVTNPLEELVLMWSVGDNKEGWIGVYWNKTLQKWVWSGGDAVIYHNNLTLQTNNLLALQSDATGNNVYWTKAGWQWKSGAESHSFFCLSLKVVQEGKTWQGALEHCRQNYGDLNSLTSETDNLLATNLIQQPGVTKWVWIGLRYLGDDWMWVDGLPLFYTNWNQDQDQCPVKNRCGALTSAGVWENRDCRETLSFICY